MFLGFMKITASAVAQSLILVAVGYFLTRKNFLQQEGVSALSRLVIEVTLPLLIFSQLIKDFSFSLYPNWWIFPLISLAIMIFGLVIGALFLGFVKGEDHKAQFLGLCAFQNSGYLPLVLLAGLLPQEKLSVIYIYMFLFLFGFNLLIFSVGVYMLALHKKKDLKLAHFFSPPVVATITSLFLVYFGINKFLLNMILTPVKMIGDCTLPLAMFVLGASLAEIRIEHLHKKEILLMSLVKLIIMPAIGLLFLYHFKLPELVGLLIIMQLAMPPATLLSVITRHYEKNDLIISQGTLVGHIIGIVTIPVFLSIYFMISVIK